MAEERRGREMHSLQERVAHLEGRTHDHVTVITDVRTDVRELRADVGRQFSEFRGEVSQRFERLEAKVDDHFKWLVGIQVTSIVALFGAIIGLYFK